MSAQSRRNTRRTPRQNIGRVFTLSEFKSLDTRTALEATFGRKVYNGGDLGRMERVALNIGR